LKSATALHAVVEAPLGQLTVSQVMYGKAAADVVTLTGVFHFDERPGGKGSPTGVAWKMGTWRAGYARR
jgi:hypothetical protein